MVRKLLIIGISLVGFTLALGSNAWADRDRGDRGNRNDKGYHHNQKVPPGHHYGWQKGKGNPHKDRYQHRQEYRARDRDHRWDRDRDRYRQDHQYRNRNHNYRSHDRYRGGRFNSAFSVIDDAFGVAVAVGGRR